MASTKGKGTSLVATYGRQRTNEVGLIFFRGNSISKSEVQDPCWLEDFQELTTIDYSVCARYERQILQLLNNFQDPSPLELDALSWFDDNKVTFGPRDVTRIFKLNFVGIGFKSKSEIPEEWIDETFTRRATKGKEIYISSCHDANLRAKMSFINRMVMLRNEEKELSRRFLSWVYYHENGQQIAWGDILRTRILQEITRIRSFGPNKSGTVTLVGPYLVRFILSTLSRLPDAKPPAPSPSELAAQMPCKEREAMPEKSSPAGDAGEAKARKKKKKNKSPRAEVQEVALSSPKEGSKGALFSPSPSPSEGENLNSPPLPAVNDEGRETRSQRKDFAENVSRMNELGSSSDSETLSRLLKRKQPVVEVGKEVVDESENESECYRLQRSRKRKKRQASRTEDAAPCERSRSQALEELLTRRNHRRRESDSELAKTSRPEEVFDCTQPGFVITSSPEMIDRDEKVERSQPSCVLTASPDHSPETSHRDVASPSTPPETSEKCVEAEVERNSNVTEVTEILEFVKISNVVREIQKPGDVRSSEGCPTSRSSPENENASSLDTKPPTRVESERESASLPSYSQPECGPFSQEFRVCSQEGEGPFSGTIAQEEDGTPSTGQGLFWKWMAQSWSQNEERTGVEYLGEQDFQCDLTGLGTSSNSAGKIPGFSGGLLFAQEIKRATGEVGLLPPEWQEGYSKNLSVLTSWINGIDIVQTQQRQLHGALQFAGRLLKDNNELRKRNDSLRNHAQLQEKKVREITAFLQASCRLLTELDPEQKRVDQWFTKVKGQLGFEPKTKPQEA